MIPKGEELVSTKEGHLNILDLSPKGIRFKTEYNLPVDRSDFHLEIRIKMKEQEITVIGHPIWRKPLGNAFLYGFTSLEDAEAEQMIVDALKAFTKNIKKKQ
jgi:hypothetical protein